MTAVYLTLAKALIGWGMLFQRGANWLIARANAGLR